MLTLERPRPDLLVIQGEEVWEWRKAQGRLKPGYQYTAAYKRGGWDGMVYPGRAKGWTVYIGRGMLARISNDLGLDVHDSEFCCDDPLEVRVPDELRDYQKRALQTAVTNEWGQIALATNAGKGAIITLLAEAAANKGSRCLIITDEISVFQALQGEIEKWGKITLGIVEAGVQTPPDDVVVLSMVPTLHGRCFPLCPDRKKVWHRKSCAKCSGGYATDETWTKWLASFNMLLADEADKATAPTWMRILGASFNTIWRFGFSGTFPNPDTLDGMVLEEHLGPILIKVKNIELVERAVSAKPLVSLYPYSHTLYDLPDGWRGMTGPERRRWMYEEGVLYNDLRHAYVESLVDPNVPTAIIVNRIDHGRILEERLEGSAFLQGANNKQERLAVLKQFERGEINPLIATKILDRGTNLLGHTVGLIFASGEGSNRQTLQRIGRGLRRAGGKEFVFIKDVIDRGGKYFNNASRKRIELYNSEGFDVEIHDENPV